MTAIASAVSYPLAQASGPSSSMCWAIVIFCVILGLLVALRPPHRTTEVKRRGE